MDPSRRPDHSTRWFAVLRGLVYGSVFVLVWAWVVVSVRPLDARIPFSIPGWTRLPGVVIAVFGGVLAVSCVVFFALSGRGTPAPFDAPREFVAVGPYRYVRNPMYLGAVAVLVGVGLVLRSPSAVTVALLFFALAHAFVLLHEEPTLERRFGDEYRRYMRSVNRWIPRNPEPSEPRWSARVVKEDRYP